VKKYFFACPLRGSVTFWSFCTSLVYVCRVAGHITVILWVGRIGSGQRKWTVSGTASPANSLSVWHAWCDCSSCYAASTLLTYVEIGRDRQANRQWESISQTHHATTDANSDVSIHHFTITQRSVNCHPEVFEVFTFACNLSSVQVDCLTSTLMLRKNEKSFGWNCEADRERSSPTLLSTPHWNIVVDTNSIIMCDKPCTDLRLHFDKITTDVKILKILQYSKTAWWLVRYVMVARLLHTHAGRLFVCLYVRLSAA